MINDTNEIEELFSPTLDEQHKQLFQELINKIDSAYPNYRDLVVKQAIDSFKVNADNIDDLMYITSLHVLYDLLQQGWRMEARMSELYLKMSAEISNDKAYIRHRLGSERRAQFNEPSVKRFINRMEKNKLFHGAQISIKNLIGDKEQLIAAINGHHHHIVQPYIQLVRQERDVHTGYLDSDIWKYFRYTWSIPYKTMPGRNLFYLVRDAAQEFHPVMGIFALGNSILNLTVRDDDIGWTVEAIKKNLQRKNQCSYTMGQVSQTNGKEVLSKKTTFLETEAEYAKRTSVYSQKTMQLLLANLQKAISEIYIKDLDYRRNTKYPTEKKIESPAHIYIRRKSVPYISFRNPSLTHLLSIKLSLYENVSKFFSYFFIEKQ